MIVERKLCHVGHSRHVASSAHPRGVWSIIQVYRTHLQCPDAKRDAIVTRPQHREHQAWRACDTI
eukprot:8254195-Pyramimonas_sp.AAC.3